MKIRELIPLLGVSISHYFHKAKADEMNDRIWWINFKINGLIIGVVIWSVLILQ